jgi:uncharacterized membrane protein
MAEGSTKITKLLDKLDKAKGHIQKAKEQGEVIAGRVSHGALTVGGGLAVGALRGYMGKPEDNYNVYLPGTKVHADLALGVLTAGAGIAGVAGKHGDMAVSFGSGILAVLVAEKTQAAIIAHDKQSARK